MRRSKTLVVLGCVPLWFCGEHLTLIPLCRNHMVSTQQHLTHQGLEVPEGRLLVYGQSADPLRTTKGVFIAFLQ